MPRPEMGRHDRDGPNGLLKQILEELQQHTRQLTMLAVVITKQGEETVATLAELEAEVARNTSVDESAIVLLNGLKARLDEIIAGGGDPVKLAALRDELASSSTKLAEAVSANTPTG